VSAPATRAVLFSNVDCEYPPPRRRRRRKGFICELETSLGAFFLY
jgi:hypothetical protein